MRFIEKRAIDLYDKGIKTIGALEEYLGEEDKRYDMEHIVRKLFGLGERAFTAKEKTYIKDWTSKWHVSEEMIGRAYEETVSKTQTPTLAYCNAILKSWHEAGIVSGEGVEKEKQSYKKKKSGAKEKDAGFAAREAELAETLNEEERLAADLEFQVEAQRRTETALRAALQERDDLARQVEELTRERADLIESQRALDEIHRALADARSRVL